MGKKIQEQLIGELVRKDAIKEDESKLFYLIPTKRYVHQEHINRQIIERLRAEVLEDGKVEDQTIMLIILLDTSNMLRGIFPPMRNSN
ncbi:GPP34 family phosphoprotein [Risungbinella massiliensis]|uniref:GPP34 family phosphoprotein n=1 Tax=Risungbinella massiliensis TaxID=1329796 RepID=UPI0005CBDE78|nr:GPP34 family phosphoprotein [Risungbinella massiliensis]